MNRGKYVFAQLIDFLPHNDFNRCINKYQGNYKVQSFTCWHQMLYMIFGLLSKRGSLSDLIVYLKSQPNSSYHLGMGKGTSKANLAKANEKRDYRIYQSFAFFLVGYVQRLDIPLESSDLSVKELVHAMDATVIELCLNIFWWGKSKNHKTAMELKATLDIKNNIPTFIYINDEDVRDVKTLDVFPIEAGGYYIIDKEDSVDFGSLYQIHQSDAFYITKVKNNLKFVRLSSRPVDKNTGLKCDQTVRLKSKKVLLSHPDNIRRIKFYDNDIKMEFVFITNNFEASAQEVAGLYKYRWSVELFFKWIKQHLKLKTFWGYSLNAVKTQVYIAMITFLLISIVKHTLNLKQTKYEIVETLSVSLLYKTPLTELFSSAYLQ